jgi:predicted Zn-dependent peptidase
MLVAPLAEGSDSMQRGSGFFVGLVCLLLGPGAAAGSTVSLESVVREFHLPNGATLLVAENHDSPTIGVVTAFSVGAAEERPGINGVTHILEHMLFKGTTEVGTSDWAAEKPHHDRIEELTLAAKQERAKGRAADTGKIEALLAERAKEMEAEKQYAIDNQLWGLYEEAGGVQLNAFTSYDVTAYVQSLPANRLELWMYLESQRLRRPILRQFYTEVQNILEERRLSVDSDPEGILQENLLAGAYDAHWYGYPIIGYPSDIASLTRTETEEWFRVYYAPNRMTLSVVGDVDPEAVHRMAAEYFGDIPRQDPPEPVETFDLPKKGARRVEVEYDAEPRVMMAWHKETVPHPEDAALRLVSEILTGGQSSRLRKILVEERQIAASVTTDHEMPGLRWPNLFVVQALPRAPHTAAEVEDAIWEQLERLKREPVPERELTKARNRLEAARVRDFESNFELAVDLAYYQASTGDWRTLVEHAKALEAVTAEDIRAVARKTFRRNGTIVATLVAPTVEIDPEKESAGREVAQRMVDALGGADKLAGVTTLAASSAIRITTPGGELTAEGRRIYAPPDRMRSEFVMFGQTQLEGVGPEGCWRTQQGQAVDVEGDDAKETRQDLERAMFFLAYSRSPDAWVLQKTGTQDGQHVVQVVGPSGGSFTVYVDVQSGLPSRAEWDGTNPMTGAAARFADEYSDFRAVAGVLRPHRVVTTVDGKPFLDATVTDLVINGDVSADAFVRPQS